MTHSDLGMTLEDFNFLMALCGVFFMAIVSYATMKLFF